MSSIDEPMASDEDSIPSSSSTGVYSSMDQFQVSKFALYLAYDVSRTDACRSRGSSAEASTRRSMLHGT